MNINGGCHHYEGFCVSWKAEAISMHATARSVRFVSGRVMSLAAAPASKKVPLLNLFYLKSQICVPGQNKETDSDRLVSSEVFVK